MQSVLMQSSKLHICGHLLFVYDNVSSLQPSTVAYFPFCQLLAHHLFTGLQLLCQQILTYFLQLRVLSCSVWGFWVFFFPAIIYTISMPGVYQFCSTSLKANNSTNHHRLALSDIQRLPFQYSKLQRWSERSEFPPECAQRQAQVRNIN